MPDDDSDERERRGRVREATSAVGGLWGAAETIGLVLVGVALVVRQRRKRRRST